MVDHGRLFVVMKELLPGMIASFRESASTATSFRPEETGRADAGLVDSLCSPGVDSVDNDCDFGSPGISDGDFLNTRSDARAINATIMNRIKTACCILKY